MLVRSKMTSKVISASPTTSIADALKLTRGNRIRHLPIMDKDRLIGIVTDRDLRLAMPPIWSKGDEHAELRTALDTKTVGEVMTKDVQTTSPDTPIEEAARQIYEHRIGCLPVMEDDRVIGILTETDLLRAFVELFGAEEQTVRLEILMGNKPGELARVVRAIGIDFKMKIPGIVLAEIREDEQLAVIHVETPNADELIEHLRRLGYKVGSPSLDLEPEPAGTAPERYRHWAAEGF